MKPNNIRGQSQAALLPTLPFPPSSARHTLTGIRTPLCRTQLDRPIELKHSSSFTSAQFSSVTDNAQAHRGRSTGFDDAGSCAAAQPGQLVELGQKLVDQVAGIAREQGAMASGQADLAAVVSVVSQKVAGLEKALAELQATVARATASASVIAAVTAERDKANLDLQKVLSAPPGRFRSKAETALFS